MRNPASGGNHTGLPLQKGAFVGADLRVCPYSLTQPFGASRPTETRFREDAKRKMRPEESGRTPLDFTEVGGTEIHAPTTDCTA
jgi:hypothetical protein